MVERWCEGGDEVCEGGDEVCEGHGRVGEVDCDGAGEHCDTGLWLFDKDCSVEA